MMVAMDRFVELKNPKTGDTVRIEWHVSLINFLFTFRYWFATAFGLGYKILGGAGLICIVLALLPVVLGYSKDSVFPFVLTYIALGAYFTLNLSALTARSYLRRGWTVTSGDPESLSRSRPLLKAALLVVGVFVVIFLFVFAKAFLNLSASQPHRKVGDFVLKSTTEIVTEAVKAQGQNPANPLVKEFISELVLCAAPTVSFDYSQDDLDKMSDEEFEKIEAKLGEDINAALVPCIKTVVENAPKKK